MKSKLVPLPSTLSNFQEVWNTASSGYCASAAAPVTAAAIGITGGFGGGGFLKNPLT